MAQPKDFSSHKHFPGETGNPLDVVLFNVVKLEQTPAIIFFIGLYLLAWLRYWQEPLFSSWLFLFFLGDWVLLRCLPVFNRSFGPAKPVVLFLAVARFLFSFFPAPWGWFIQE